jgi:hypothetical protein
MAGSGDPIDLRVMRQRAADLALRARRKARAEPAAHYLGRVTGLGNGVVAHAPVVVDTRPATLSGPEQAGATAPLDAPDSGASVPVTLVRGTARDDELLIADLVGGKWLAQHKASPAPCANRLCVKVKYAPNDAGFAPDLIGAKAAIIKAGAVWGGEQTIGDLTAEVCWDDVPYPIDGIRVTLPTLSGPYAVLMPATLAGCEVHYLFYACLDALCAAPANRCGLGVAGATVTFSGPGGTQTLTSDGKGVLTHHDCYRYGVLAAGTYTVTASKTGLLTATGTATLAPRVYQAPAANPCGYDVVALRMGAGDDPNEPYPAADWVDMPCCSCAEHGPRPDKWPKRLFATLHYQDKAPLCFGNPYTGYYGDDDGVSIELNWVDGVPNPAGGLGGWWSGPRASGSWYECIRGHFDGLGRLICDVITKVYYDSVEVWAVPMNPGSSFPDAYGNRACAINVYYLRHLDPPHPPGVPACPAGVAYNFGRGPLATSTGVYPIEPDNSVAHGRGCAPVFISLSSGDTDPPPASRTGTLSE